MPNVELPLKLYCFEYRTRLAGGVSRPLLMAAQDENGGEVEMVLKVRKPDANHGHFGATSLALELICSMVARAVGLMVPDYAILDVPAGLADSIEDDGVRQLLTANEGENFGCQYLEQVATWNPASAASPSDETLERIEDVMTFDATVMNGDRTRGKANLLTRGNIFWLIDHSLAMAAHAWPPQVRAENPLMRDPDIRNHCGFSGLRGRARLFEQMLARWRENLSQADIATMRGAIPLSWEETAGDLDSIFAFLGNRNARFPDITAGLRRVIG
jgi:hypothetical protein